MTEPPIHSALIALRDEMRREAAKTECYTCYTEQAAYVARKLDKIISEHPTPDSDKQLYNMEVKRGVHVTKDFAVDKYGVALTPSEIPVLAIRTTAEPISTPTDLCNRIVALLEVEARKAPEHSQKRTTWKQAVAIVRAQCGEGE